MLFDSHLLQPQQNIKNMSLLNFPFLRLYIWFNIPLIYKTGGYREIFHNSAMSSSKNNIGKKSVYFLEFQYI